MPERPAWQVQQRPCTAVKRAGWMPAARPPGTVPGALCVRLVPLAILLAHVSPDL